MAPTLRRDRREVATEVEEEEAIPISKCKHDALNASTPTALFEPPIALALGGASQIPQPTCF